MRSRILTLLLLVGLAGITLTWIPSARTRHLPGNEEGYEPAQPIAFSHRLHAGDLLVPCLYCHWAAETSRYAGIPAVSICMNCHESVTAPWGAIREEDALAQKEKRRPERIISAEIQKIYDALALNDKFERDPAKTLRPVSWTQVYNLPDFVFFDHRAHVNAGVQCQRCHGPVETMERMREVQPLTMGWCVTCHRDVTKHGLAGEHIQASIDCSTCHF